MKRKPRPRFELSLTIEGDGECVSYRRTADTVPELQRVMSELAAEVERTAQPPLIEDEFTKETVGDA